MKTTPGNMDNAHVLKMCQLFASEVMEHGDSVRIFVTGRGDGMNTASVTHGIGNWHAQRGQIASWSRQEDERDREEMRQAINNNDEGSDDLKPS